METTRPHRKILRSPSVKRKSKVLPVNQRVQLERVLGLTGTSNAGLSCDSNSGTIAYPAGCVTVLFNPRRNKQSHIFNTHKKAVTAVAFSPDGKHLVTGETGHQPAVRVWDVAEKTQVAEFHGHKFGVNCVAFSPNQKEVVSVGTQHDMMINVWNWKTGMKVASNKVSSKVSALAFSEDGKCFVTVGNRHVRFWYLEDRRSKINQTVPLMGRNGILGDQKDNFFCDVVAGQGSMCGRFFVITQSGLLCEFNEKRLLDKWVELMTKTASCITAGQEHIFVGCAEGVVRVFSALSLHYVCTLPPPHPLGVEVTTATSPSHLVSNRQDSNYPDTKAIAVDDDHKKVTCIYNDRSIYIWDVHDLKRVGKAWSFLYHSGCIWSLEMYPPLEEDGKAVLPPGSFLTASGDNTIRVWNLNTHMPENTAYKRNIYSNELLKIVYADPSLGSLCNVDYNPAGATDKTDTTYDGKNGVRSIRVSPDGAHLASGDRQGNIRIYDMEYLTEQKCVEAHESDVMCLEYSYTKEGRLLATSSRDRLIHVFDVDASYGLVQTLGDHSSSITAVRFMDKDDKLRMISCGADKSILLRNAVTSPDLQFQLEHHLATKITLYDMVIDPTQRCLATACQDRNVRLYNIQTTKEKKCYRGSAGDEGVLLRIHLDPSGTFAATSCTDKNVCILDFNSGELLATMYGHSEVITGVKFANDLKHVITVSADGCIFVWRLPKEMTTQIKTRLLELGKKLKDTDFLRCDEPLMPNPVLINSPSTDGTFQVNKSASLSFLPRKDNDAFDGRIDDYDDDDDEDDDDELFDDGASTTGVNFSPGPLPSWAKAKFGDANSKANDSGQEHVQPKGRWAQRVDHNMEFKSQLDLTQSEEDSLHTDRRRPFAVDKADVSHKPDLRRETVVVSKKNLPSLGQDIRGSTGDLRTNLSTTVKAPRSIEQPKHREANFFKSDTSLNTSASSPKRWSDRFDLIRGNSVELEDTDDLDTGSDTTEIIYPPAESDFDPFASSYRVFAVENARKSAAKNAIGNVLATDDASESTDPISLEDEDEGNDETLVSSTPTTPSDPDKDFLAGTPDKEDFVRENFEEATFSQLPLEEFLETADILEQQATERGAGGAAAGTPARGARLQGLESSTPFSPRLSLSARFMSRAGPSVFKNSLSSYVASRQDNWFNRNKMELTRAMDETRKSLLAMNSRNDFIGSNSPEKEDPPSPPTKLEEENQLLDHGTQYACSPPSAYGSNPWDYHCKNLRRMWAAFTLSKDCIMEECLVPAFSFDVGSPPESLVGSPSITQDFFEDDVIGGSLIKQSQSRKKQSKPRPPEEVLASDLRLSDVFSKPVHTEHSQPGHPSKLQKHLYHQQHLYHSRIPTPMASPRPARAKRQNFKYPVTSTSTSSLQTLSASSSTGLSSPEKECASLKTLGPGKTKDVRLCRTANNNRLNTKNGSCQKRSGSSSRSNSGNRSSSCTTSNGSSSSGCSSGSKTSNQRSFRGSTSSDTLSPSSPASASFVQNITSQGRGRGARTRTSSSPSSCVSSSPITTTFCTNCRTLSKSRSPSSSSSSSRDRARDMDGRLKSGPNVQKPVRTSVGLTSPVKPSPPVITSPAARRINQERERRRSTSKPPTDGVAEDVKENSGGPVGGPASGSMARRTRPTYFKPTQSSKNKTSRNGEEVQEMAHKVTPVFGSGGGGASKLNSRMKLLSSKKALYASSPNLMSSLDDDEEENTVCREGTENKQLRKPKVTKMKQTSTSNLRLLSDLSRSVPDVNDEDSSTDSSSAGSGPGSHQRPAALAKTIGGSRFSYTATGNRLHQPSALPSQSLRAVRGGEEDSATANVTQPRRKTSASEMTLDQAKSILLGKSGLLGSKMRLVSDSGAGTSVQSSNSPESTPSSLASTVTSDSSPQHFDLAHASPAQRALVQDIEQTANSLRQQQQQQCQGNAYSPQRPPGQPLSNLEASPLDLPERDQPGLSQHHLTPKSLSVSLDSCVPPKSSQMFHHINSRAASANNTFVVQDVEVTTSMNGDTSNDEEDVSRSVRERIAQFQSPKPGASMLELDRSRLSLPLSQATLPALPQVSIAQCQSVIEDFQEKLHSLKEIFSQVEGRSDENARQVLSLLGAAFHQTNRVIADLASKAPSPPQSDGDAQYFSITDSSSMSQVKSQLSAPYPSSSSSSASSSQGLHTFQSQAATHRSNIKDNENSSSTVKMTTPHMQGSQEAADSLSEAARDMLQPLLSQFSAHLSEEIVKFIQDKSKLYQQKQ